MTIVNLNHKNKRIEFKPFEMENELVFQYFDKLSAKERDDKLLKALHIGVVAMLEDRISSFLAKTSNELGSELESLKLIYDMQSEAFFKSTQKGVDAEKIISEYLSELSVQRNFKDTISLSGFAAGALKNNKTGDIICDIEGNADKRISIECKFDKSVRMGELEKTQISTRKSDTIWSQLIESELNRSGKTSIIVLDIAIIDSVVEREVQNVKYIPSVGFVVIVDSQKGDFNNLAIAYVLARDIAQKPKLKDFDSDLLNSIIKKIISDAREMLSIRNSVLSNIKNNKAILESLEKNLLTMEFNFKYLSKFIESGTLSKADLLDYYMADEIRDKYKIIKSDIEAL